MKRKRGRPQKRPTKEEFERLYYDSAITIYELSDHWGVVPQTIYNWARYFKKGENTNGIQNI